MTLRTWQSARTSWKTRSNGCQDETSQRQVEEHDGGDQEAAEGFAQQQLAEKIGVREVVELMTARAAEKGVELKMELSDDLEPLRFDPDGIHRCLLNLVTNAIDACCADNCHDKDRTVTIRALKPEGWAVEYQVVDTGSGMNKEIQDKIFQSFFSTKGTRGTGIGLMMTKKIVDQHQGVIEVTSQKGAGSTVVIKLPFAPEDRFL